MWIIAFSCVLCNTQVPMGRLLCASWCVNRKLNPLVRCVAVSSLFLSEKGKKERDTFMVLSMYLLLTFYKCSVNCAENVIWDYDFISSVTLQIDNVFSKLLIENTFQ